MKKEDQKKLIKYWQETAKHDYETMESLFEGKRYDASLFFGHIVLEKILKAHVIQKEKRQAPRIHNLVQLAEIARIDLDKETREFLAIVNRFNMRSRYPDTKLSFYKLCTPQYAEENLNKIKQLYKELCQKLKPKK